MLDVIIMFVDNPRELNKQSVSPWRPYQQHGHFGKNFLPHLATERKDFRKIQEQIVFSCVLKMPCCSQARLTQANTQTKTRFPFGVQ